MHAFDAFEASINQRETIVISEELDLRTPEKELTHDLLHNLVDEPEQLKKDDQN